MAGGGRTLGISPDMDVSDDKDEYKRSMRNQRAKDIGLAGVAGALSGGKLAALGLDYMGRRKAEKKDSVKENQKEYGMKKGGMMKKMAMGGYADGGMPMVMKDGVKVPAFAADDKGKMKHGGMAMKKMASGGMTSMGKVKTAAPSKDGVAMKGKTKGTMVKMAGSTGMKKGGMAKMNKGGRAC